MESPICIPTYAERNNYFYSIISYFSDNESEN